MGPNSATPSQPSPENFPKKPTLSEASRTPEKVTTQKQFDALVASIDFLSVDPVKVPKQQMEMILKNPEKFRAYCEQHAEQENGVYRLFCEQESWKEVGETAAQTEKDQKWAEKDQKWAKEAKKWAGVKEVLFSQEAEKILKQHAPKAFAEAEKEYQKEVVSKKTPDTPSNRAQFLSSYISSHSAAFLAEAKQNGPEAEKAVKIAISSLNGTRSQEQQTGKPTDQHDQTDEKTGAVTKFYEKGSITIDKNGHSVFKSTEGRTISEVDTHNPEQVLVGRLKYPLSNAQSPEAVIKQQENVLLWEDKLTEVGLGDLTAQNIIDLDKALAKNTSLLGGESLISFAEKGPTQKSLRQRLDAIGFMVVANMRKAGKEEEIKKQGIPPLFNENNGFRLNAEDLKQVIKDYLKKSGPDDKQEKFDHQNLENRLKEADTEKSLYESQKWKEAINFALNRANKDVMKIVEKWEWARATLDALKFDRAAAERIFAEGFALDGASKKTA